MKKQLLGIGLSIAAFFASSIFLPFPFGFGLSIGIPVIILFYVFRGAKFSLLVSKPAMFIQNLSEKRIQFLLVFIFAFSFASSVMYPFVNDLLGLPTTYGIDYPGSSGMHTESYAWPTDDDRPTFVNGVLYRFALLALYAVFPIYMTPPAAFTIPRGIFWVIAIISIFVIKDATRTLKLKRRILYAYFCATLISSMWASFYVWHSIYDSSIIPGV